MVDSERVAGSTTEFDDDWRRALANNEARYFIYPSKNSGRQADLFEWIKAQQIETLLRETGIQKGRILEYGCGAAGISLYLAKQGHKSHICDLSPYALKVAESNRVRHASNAHFETAISANVMELPYASNSFDVVMSYGLLEHFEMAPLHRLLDETIRVLRPGGLFIADIVPGPERFNVRTVGLLISYLGSLAVHLATGKWRRAATLYHQYFEYYFESTHDDRKWVELLGKHDLKNIKVDVCRPFPPLALSGATERLYTSIILRFLAFHQLFDGANNWLTRRWGWMYLSIAVKVEGAI